MVGLRLFESETLAVIAQQNAANAPFPLSSNITAQGFAVVGQQFNLQANQGGSVFSPDGATLYSAFNIAPIQSPAARANVTQLLVNDADNLLIQDGLQLPENLAGKMVMSLDEPAFMRFRNPVYDHSVERGVAESTAAAGLQRPAAGFGPVQLSARGKNAFDDQPDEPETPDYTGYGYGDTRAIVGRCGGSGDWGLVRASLAVRAVERRAAESSSSLPRFPFRACGHHSGLTNRQQVTQQTAPSLRVVRDGPNTSFEIAYNFVNSRSLGMPAAHDFLITSPQAVNVPATIRVFQNSRNTESRGDLIPVLNKAISPNEGLTDIIANTVRNRLYISNSGMNCVEVFDTRGKRFLAPIKVGQLPRSLAMSPDLDALCGQYRRRIDQRHRSGPATGFRQYQVSGERLSTA